MIQLARRARVATVGYECEDIDPTADPTADLGDEIAALAAHLDAATHRLLTLLYEFDERNGWCNGFRTCAHWLSWRTGMDLGAAREKMRVARALHGLPVLSDAMRRGELSYSKARALTRIASPANEADLMELAMHGTAAHIERIVRSWRTIDRNEDFEREEERHERRTLSLIIDDDGSYVLRGRLDPEVGAVLERALEMAREELYGCSSGGHAAQERADAIGLLAELTLQRIDAGARADASVSIGTNGPATRSARVSGTRAERFQVVLHVDNVALQADGVVSTKPDAGMCELENGVRVSAETSRRLACDATRVIMVHGEHGKVLDVQRRTRTVPPALRRALDRRDHGCRFPGCGLRFCDAHHVQHWADGGVTALDNLVLLCRFHHRLLHEGGYTMAFDEDRNVVFRDPDWNHICDAPRAAPIFGDAVEQLRKHHEQVGLWIDGDTAPLWNGDGLDVHLAMVMLRPVDAA
jgi:hypothetical protein